MSADASALKEKWRVYTHAELRQRCLELGSGDYLIEGILPGRFIGLVVGDSGLGKSPLLYQAAICIASGKPFLGHQVHQAKVLFMDFENGLMQVEEIVSRLLRHLGLDEAPDSLLLWNGNDRADPSKPPWETDMIKIFQPGLVILDSITAAAPVIEEKNVYATRFLQHLRGLASGGTAMLGIHHRRKPSVGAPRDSLEKADLTAWFNESRGASALINASDLRLGVDVPARGADLIVRGFMRVTGEIPAIYLNRAFQGDGEPIGFEKLTGPELLHNPDQEAAFGNLPQSFRFKDAQQIYGKGGQPTTNFLRKCQAVGILRKVEGGYEKVKPVEQLE